MFIWICLFGLINLWIVLIFNLFYYVKCKKVNISIIEYYIWIRENYIIIIDMITENYREKKL